MGGIPPAKTSSDNENFAFTIRKAGTGTFWSTSLVAEKKPRHTPRAMMTGLNTIPGKMPGIIELRCVANGILDSGLWD